MKRILLIALLIVLVAACNRREKNETPVQSGGSVDRGKAAIQRYGCQACHKVPGVDGPQGMVAPSLEHMAARHSIAGKFPNTPENMTQWLQNPQSMDPNNAMPNLRVTAEDSRDMTAYLSTLK